VTLLNRQFLDLPGAPRRSVSPVVTFGNIAPSGSLLLGAGATFNIRHDTRGVNPPASNNWNIGVNNIFSWAIVAATANDNLGATLQFLVSADGVAFNLWKNFVIDGFGVPTVFTDVEVPGWQCRINLINASLANITTISGMIRLQGK